MAGDEMAPQEKKQRKRRRGRRAKFPEMSTYDVTAEVRRRGLDTPEAIVDHFAATLLAVPASAGTKKTLIDYLTRDGGFRIDNNWDAKQRLHGLLRLIVSTPEFQLF